MPKREIATAAKLPIGCDSEGPDLRTEQVFHTNSHFRANGTPSCANFAGHSLRRLREITNPRSPRLTTDLVAGRIGTVAG